MKNLAVENLKSLRTILNIEATIALETAQGSTEIFKTF